MRRAGWLIFAGVAAICFAGTVIGGAWMLGIALSDGTPFAVLTVAIQTALMVVFWRWIGLGAWLRANPPLGEDGLPVRTLEPVGPWGVVGRLLLSLLAVGAIVVSVWGAVDDQNINERADRVRADAERAAKGAGLTVADVERASVAVPLYDDLLRVDDAVVTKVSVTKDGAAILLRLDESPPCVVVTIDRRELIRSRVTNDC